ncbi:MAG: hypothetical protein QOJ23_4202 [Actinomycetota bacterium]|nr:hypothetical protein [Actinomycetota bacterium]
MTIADRTWDDLPAEIHARVMAATGQAQTRRIEHSDASDADLPQGIWTVDAVAGDRFVHQILGLRGDGSVFEETRTFLTDEIAEVSFDSDGATVVVPGPSGAESIRVPDSIGRAVNRRNEAGLERAAKGIGQGIAGRLKEVAGEFLDDPDLEEAGIVQQLEGRIRRAEGDDQT